MRNEFDILLSKIDEFRQKYYLNKIIRGLIITAASSLILGTGSVLTLYYVYPPAVVKTFMFLLVVGINIFVAAKYLLKPLLSYLHLTKSLTTEEAAVFIGEKLENIQDKIINALQLQALSAKNENNSIIIAGINQKISELKPIPFTRAVDLKVNHRHLKWVFIPLCVIVLVALIAPGILSIGSRNFLSFTQTYSPPAPFEFKMLNPLSVSQGSDLVLEVQLTGDQLPNDIYVEIGSSVFKMEKISHSGFNHTLYNVQDAQTIRFSGGGFYSDFFKVDVVPKPEILQVTAVLQYPKYLKKQDQLINGVGDLTLPEGTHITWRLNAKHAKSLTFQLDNQKHNVALINQSAQFKTKITESGFYSVVIQNEESADSVGNYITMLKDQFPAIYIKELNDSLSNKVKYFEGQVSDDYGLSSLFFHYEIRKDNITLKKHKTNILLPPNGDEFSFFHMWDLDKSEIDAGAEVFYYFEIYDNDGVNGPKSTKSETFSLKRASHNQILETLSEESSRFKDQISDAIKLSKTVEKESKRIADLLADKKDLTIEDKKLIESLLEKQQSLEKMVSRIQEENQKNTFKKQDNDLLNKDLLKKQEQIDELFNNVLDEKTKLLLRKLEQLMQENNKNMSREQLSQMQMDNQSLNNELDRILELYKTLEFEQQLHQTIDQLKNLADQQEALGNESVKKVRDLEQLKKEQDALNNTFKDIKSALEDLNTKNQSLEQPQPFAPNKASQNNISDAQQQSQNSLNKKERQAASEQQKNAAALMKKLAKEMEQSLNEHNEQQNNVNAESVRKLLAKLLTTSFDQEGIMQKLRAMASNDPLYSKQAQLQRTIKDNVLNMADSLVSLGKKVPQLQQSVLKEMGLVQENVDESLKLFGDRRTGEVVKFQQRAMTSMNNLALMLDEVLNQIQDASPSGESGQGKSAKNMSDLQKMQQELNERMEKARQDLEQGGNQGDVPKRMTEQFGQMARQQQVIREALQRLNNAKSGDQATKQEMNNTIQQMKKTENELVNKKILEESLHRQQNILTKLLEAENAEKEQELDQKREAKAGKELPPSYQKLLEQFKKNQSAETELLRKIPLNLTDFYKQKVQEYYKNLQRP